MNNVTKLMLVTSLLVTSSAWAADPQKKGGVKVTGDNVQVGEVDDGDDADENTVEVGDGKVKVGNLVVSGVANEGGGVISPDGKTLSLSGNSSRLEHTCKEGAAVNIVISGNSHDVLLKGDCESVTVSGNSHKVSVEGAAKITVSGNASKLSYLRGLKGKPPKIVKSGNATSVSKRDS